MRLAPSTATRTIARAAAVAACVAAREAHALVRVARTALDNAESVALQADTTQVRSEMVADRLDRESGEGA